MVASGQVGTRNFKGNAAPVFVWDMELKKRVIALRGEFTDSSVALHVIINGLILLLDRPQHEGQLAGVF
jgi:hypothetical protein